MDYKERDELLEHLKDPKSVHDLVEEYEGGNKSYYTMRRKVLELVEDGVVTKLLLPQNKRTMFVATSNRRRGLVVPWHDPNVINVGELIRWTESFVRKGEEGRGSGAYIDKMITRGLIHLVANSEARQVGHDPYQPVGKKVQQLFLWVRYLLRMRLSAIETLIRAEIWNEDDDLMQRFELDYGVYEELQGYSTEMTHMDARGEIPYRTH
jgi:hypothetical protein